jgi:LPS export ABC transporter protein LptC
MTAHFHVHWPPLALALALSLLALWLNQAAHRPLHQEVADLAPSPDYVVDDFDATVFGANGQPKHRVTARRLTHSLQKDETLLDAPHYLSADAAQPVEVTAQRALLQGDAQLLYFLGSVHAIRRSATAAPLTLDSEYLVVHPDRHLLRTNKPVQLKQGGMVITAGGMVVDETNKQLALTGGVRGVYEKNR